MEYIDAQFEAYLQEELKIKRSLFNYHDTRIHACLYFIAPTGHSLKSLDLVTMKKLDSKVLDVAPSPGQPFAKAPGYLWNACGWLLLTLSFLLDYGDRVWPNKISAENSLLSVRRR